MEENIEEIYAKDKPELSELIQSWIDENIESITCNYLESVLKCNQSR